MHVSYEWDVETVTTTETGDHEAGEVMDHNHFDTYAEAVAFMKSDPGDGLEYKCALVRDDHNGRTWAYVENGRLPEWFEDARGVCVCKVPQRFALKSTGGAK